MLSLFASMAMSSVSAGASPTFPLDPRISTVRSGGYWEQGERRGGYRVVVAHFGSEHVSSHIRFEWVTDAQEVARAEVLHGALLGSVDIESMSWDEAGTHVVLSGDLRNGSKYKCKVSLRTDGSYSKGEGC